MWPQHFWCLNRRLSVGGCHRQTPSELLLHVRRTELRKGSGHKAGGNMERGGASVTANRLRTPHDESNFKDATDTHYEQRTIINLDSSTR